MVKRWRVDWWQSGGWRTFRFMASQTEAVSLAVLLTRGGLRARVYDLRQVGVFAQYG